MVTRFAPIGAEQAQLNLWLEWDADRKEGKKVLPFFLHLCRIDARLATLDHSKEWVAELHEAVRLAIENWVA